MHKELHKWKLLGGHPDLFRDRKPRDLYVFTDPGKSITYEQAVCVQAECKHGKSLQKVVQTQGLSQDEQSGLLEQNVHVLVVR